MSIHKEVSTTHHIFKPRDIAPFVLGVDYGMDDAAKLMKMVGIGFNRSVMKDMNDYYGMDTIQQPLTNPSIAVPVQFLQNWLPGVVEITTAALMIDEITGVTTAGAWEDDAIVQTVMETSGAPVPYGDTSVVPLANYNLNYVQRNVVRMEQGMRVGNLEELRVARVRVDSASSKRSSAAIQLEITRNAIGFYGYDNGDNFTYGLLNDPNLSNYHNVAAGTGGTTWATKTFLEIQADLLTAFQGLRTQSQGRIKPNKDPITLVLPTDSVDYLAKTSDFGISVYTWLKEFYANVRVVDAPQFNNANGGANVFYVFADTVDDGVSSDDKRTFIQVVPSRFQLMGVQKLTKGFEEDYSNATAGIMCKRPYAVYRASGI